eukprot:CAMPEP_0195039930 /NCGR_PEP_ID=MMETSP0326_2-20130528/80067_1 /TAXON_ID=2866 ORGANISM="Crypthecodinium cohnii, Strain Seligo" /NCGR_SAMPLE_ID=MMETSP0326_2 /ASSEMBLY_ACC=CAM_ASM_000348 /LENGTH=50 /DNA_ID=CAMNT_0040066823 /DNA_START=169 /DNA_END=321 /DNA_ORIENTATION=-
MRKVMLSTLGSHVWNTVQNSTMEPGRGGGVARKNALDAAYALCGQRAATT